MIENPWSTPGTPNEMETQQPPVPGEAADFEELPPIDDTSVAPLTDPDDTKGG